MLILRSLLKSMNRMKALDHCLKKARSSFGLLRSSAIINTEQKLEKPPIIHAYCINIFLFLTADRRNLEVSIKDNNTWLNNLLTNFAAGYDPEIAKKPSYIIHQLG